MNTLKSTLLSILFFSLLVSPINAEPQRISCPSGDFSIITPQSWTLILEEGDLLAFQGPTKQAVMSFKKMPPNTPDLKTFSDDYIKIMKGTGAKIIPQKMEMINETETLKFNIKIAKQTPQSPNMQGQIYLFSVNENIYFFESFGLDAVINHAALFKSTAASFQIK